jgi:hypothetical protein
MLRLVRALACGVGIRGLTVGRRGWQTEGALIAFQVAQKTQRWLWEETINQFFCACLAFASRSSSEML